MSYLEHSLLEEVLLLCREAVCIFYSPSRLGNKMLHPVNADRKVTIEVILGSFLSEKNTQNFIRPVCHWLSEGQYKISFSCKHSRIHQSLWTPILSIGSKCVIRLLISTCFASSYLCFTHFCTEGIQKLVFWWVKPVFKEWRVYWKIKEFLPWMKCESLYWKIHLIYWITLIYIYIYHRQHGVQLARIFLNLFRH